jgi:hypothetical protein
VFSTTVTMFKEFREDTAGHVVGERHPFVFRVRGPLGENKPTAHAKRTMDVLGCRCRVDEMRRAESADGRTSGAGRECNSLGVC